MKPERWQQVQALFEAALDQEPEARPRFLADSAGTDEELRQEAASLIAAFERSGDFFEQPAAEHLKRHAYDPLAAELPTRVGPYKLVRELGEGGMGVVYEGTRDDDQYQKQVAIKLLRMGLASDRLATRFRRERQILARLEHPHIARLLDGGVTADNLPWFAMEFVEGERCDQYCNSRRLPIEDRLRLFLDVCDAVQYAHRNLVVHRDLKPSNILVTGEGVVKLVDFGIAKPVAGSTDEETEQTFPGLEALTPEYASPEQLRGSPITTSSDIYSLGVVLYRLLTGAKPYSVTQSSIHEMARVICETEPAPPSTAVTDRQAWHSGEASAERLRRKLSGELDNIVLMAMRKEPERRYATIEQFADDVRAYLEGRPVIAQKSTTLYQLRKFARRNRIAVAAAALVTLSLVGGIVATTWQAKQAERARADAEQRFDDVRELSNLLLFDVYDAISALPGATPARELIVNRSLGHLDRLSREAVNDPELKLEVARGYLRLARVQGGPSNANLGQLEQARESYLKALSISEALLLRQREDQEARRIVALAHEGLGDVLAWRGNEEEGVEHARLALEQWEHLAAATPDDPRSGLTVAVSRLKLGDLLGNPGFPNLDQPDAALEQYQASLAILDSLQPDSSISWRVRRQVGLLHERRGTMFLSTGRHSSALKEFRLSLALRDSLAAEQPTDGDAIRDAGIAHEKICQVQIATGEAGAAISECSAALDVYQNLYAADPENQNAARTLALGYRWMYEAYRADNDPVNALKAIGKSNSLLQGILAQAPENSPFRRELGNNLLRASMAHATIASGRRSAAATPGRSHVAAVAAWDSAQVLLAGLPPSRASRADTALREEARRMINQLPLRTDQQE